MPGASIWVNPHISHLFVVSRLKGAWMVTFPTEGRAGIVETMLSSPTEEKSSDGRLSVGVIEGV